MAAITISNNALQFDAIQAKRRLRVALLASDDPQHQYLRARLEQMGLLVGAIIEPGNEQQKRLFRERKMKAYGFRRYHALRQRLTGRAAYRHSYFTRPDNQKLLAEVKTHTVSWINSKESQDYLAAMNPDVTVVCGTGVLHRSILKVGGAMINIHGGYLPDYRGNHCIFFAYSHRKFHKIGATLHLVSAALDGGDIIAVVRPDVYPHDSDEHLYCRALDAGIQHLCVLLAKLEQGKTNIYFKTQQRVGKMYYHRSRTPVRELRLWGRRVLGWHPVPRLAGALEESSRVLAPVQGEKPGVEASSSQ